MTKYEVRPVTGDADFEFMGPAVEVVRTFASYDLARCLVGFRPTVDMATGLARTWTWLRDEAPRLGEL